MHSPLDPLATIEFGRFRVVPRRRELLSDNLPVSLGGRAFDVLMALIEAHGHVIGKHALMQRVWPGNLVQENNLQAQIAALRRALGADRELVRTVAGQGYQFVGTPRVVVEALPPVKLAPVRPAMNLPEPISELIGRDGEISEILHLAAKHRLLTLTGAGGIGKTRLGLQAARRLAPDIVDGVWLVELAPLSDPGLVPIAVATALGLELATGSVSALTVATALRSKCVLLVLDNCEHVLDAAAQIADAVLHVSPAARLIATSREPLGAEGECVYRVPPLAVPTEASSGENGQLRYGAFRLFAERVSAIEPAFAVNATNSAAIAGICRQLDGIPLAIELAAARAAVLGVDGIAARLGDRLRLLAGGRRTAMPRHRTLQATLDWSHELLTQPERIVLRRLAVFPGGFTLAAARHIVADTTISEPEVVDCIASLVAKSLITIDPGAAGLRHRLLETTRAYALEKLSQAGEAGAVARCHALYFLSLSKNAEAEAEGRPTDEWLADYGPRLDNIRAALDWCFSPGGDRSIGASLTISAVPLWLQLSLMDECRARVERALDAEGTKELTQRQEMQLRAALGAALSYTKGPVPETGAAWLRALELAEGLADVRFQLAALWGLSFYHSISGAHRTELEYAERFRSLADRTDPAGSRVGDRMMGTALHYLGQHAESRRYIERVVASSAPSIERVRLYRFQFDQLSAARCVLSHVLWVQGFPDQAMRTARDSIDGAWASGHALSVCNALAQAACPTTVFVGDLAAAEHFAATLIEHAERHAMGVWHIWGRCWMGAVLIRRGNFDSGFVLLQPALRQLQQAGYVLRLTGFLSLLAEGLGDAGKVAQGLLTIEEALALAERGRGGWCLPELLRVKGKLLHLQAAPGSAAAAEDLFRRSLAVARALGALSWELRATMDLARLWCDATRGREARDILTSAYGRFTEGFETADLRAAKALIDRMQ